MARCSCCQKQVAELVEAPNTKQLVCVRCLALIRGMLGMWDVLISAVRHRKEPSRDA